MNRYSNQVFKYFELYQKIEKQFSKGAKPLLKGLKIVTGETVVRCRPECGWNLVAGSPVT